MSWVKDIFDPDERRWEDLYRNRFQHDKRVRTTHGVNCTGVHAFSYDLFPEIS